MELDKAIQSRRSVRKFKDKKPDWRDIIECIDSMRHAPMAGNNFTLNFILVDAEDKIRKIAEASQQEFIIQAKYVLVVCSDPSRTLNAYGERGEIYFRQQAGAAIQNFLLKITEAGLATCWVGHFVEEQIRKELKIPEKMKVEAFFPIGSEFKKPATKKAKIGLDNILYFNNYNNKQMKVTKKVEGRILGKSTEKPKRKI